MQKLYTNGTILTMKDDDLYSEALLIKDGLIQAVGSKSSLEALCEADCERVDLNGQCLMPSFIDAHSKKSRLPVESGSWASGMTTMH